MIALPTLPPEATDSRLRAFYEYWRSKAPDGRLPGRQHIDPLDVPALLPSLMLLDVVPQQDAAGAGPGEHRTEQQADHHADQTPLRFRVRLAGGMVVEVLGVNPTGRFIDEVIVSGRKEMVNAAFAAVARQRIAHFWENQLWSAGREHVRLQRLALPLARDGAAVDMVVACYVQVEYGPEGKMSPGDAFPIGR